MVGVCCSVCHWSKRCLGCAIEPSTGDAPQLQRLLLRNTYIACEWDISFFEEQSDPQGQNCQLHESVSQIQADLDKPVPLTDCFRLFSQGDILNVNCYYCKKQQRPMKKVNSVQQCPPVLVLHLKRFKMVSL